MDKNHEQKKARKIHFLQERRLLTLHWNIVNKDTQKRNNHNMLVTYPTGPYNMSVYPYFFYNILRCPVTLLHLFYIINI